MNCIERGCNANLLISLDTKLGEDRIISVEKEIDKEVANQFRKQMLYLNRESTTEPIIVCINSSGGEISQGLAMYDIIRGSIAPVKLVCTGEAYSMAAILLACGKPEHGRYILPNSKVMIHEPLIPGGVGGKTSSIKSISDNLLETRSKLNGILAKHTGHTIEEIDAATSYDHYFTAEEAVAYGLCDRIVDFSFLIKEVHS